MTLIKYKSYAVLSGPVAHSSVWWKSFENKPLTHSDLFEKTFNYVNATSQSSGRDTVAKRDIQTHLGCINPLTKFWHSRFPYIFFENQF